MSDPFRENTEALEARAAELEASNARTRAETRRLVSLSVEPSTFAGHPLRAPVTIFAVLVGINVMAWFANRPAETRVVAPTSYLVP